MSKRCTGNPEWEREHIAGFSDENLMWAVSEHARPEWWKDNAHNNQAYLKRWGTYLRREARKRGLL